MDRRKGAIVSLNFTESQEKFMSKFKEDLECYMAECINRGILKNEIFKMINEAIDIYINENEIKMR